MRQLLAHCASPAWLLRASAGQVFFVVGKNYRLQDIQLSKNASYFEAPGCQHSAAIPPEHRLRGEPLSQSLVKCRERYRSTNLLNLRPESASCKLIQTAFSPRRLRPEGLLTGLPAVARLRRVAAPARRTLVENTGLEPVTSWLQTRRSP